MTKRTEKPWEMIELELWALTALRADPDVATYDAFRASFATYLKTVQHLDEGSLERALLDLDRGEIELPRSLPFERPGSASRVR